MAIGAPVLYGVIRPGVICISGYVEIRNGTYFALAMGKTDAEGHLKCFELYRPMYKMSLLIANGRTVNFGHRFAHIQRFSAGYSDGVKQLVVPCSLSNAQ